jgi:hypothetical protein
MIVHADYRCNFKYHTTADTTDPSNKGHGYGYGAWRQIQQYFSLIYIVIVSFMCEGNRSIGKNHQLPKVTDKHYHIKLYRVHLAMNSIWTHT